MTTLSTTETIRAAVARLGECPLDEASLREHVWPLFSRVLERDEIYLANHSLGRPLDATAHDVAEALDLWYRDLDGAWEGWFDEREAFRSRIARLIGLGQPDAVVPKDSAGQGLRAVLNALPSAKPTVVATRGEFDSIDFILKAYAHKGRAAMKWVEPDDSGLFDAGEIVYAIEDDTDLVVVPAVLFATGQLLGGLDDIVTKAHGCGALVLVDAYHAVGTIPVDFAALGADFMIGGCYKYARGGPGACWLAIHPRHLNDAGTPDPGGLFSIDTGWFAKREPFVYTRSDRPEYSADGNAWLESTPAILTPYQARAGLELTLAIGVDRLRAYSIAQLDDLGSLLQARGVWVRSVGQRGAFLLVPADDAGPAITSLKAAGINADARPDPRSDSGGGNIRLCPDLLTGRNELEQAAGIIARVLGSTR